MGDREAPTYAEVDLQRFLEHLIRLAFGKPVRSEERIDRRHIVDLVSEAKDQVRLIEVRRTVPQTSRRLDDLISQLQEYLTSYEARTGVKAQAVLAIPGSLGQNHLARLQHHGIEVWDAEWISRSADQFGLREEADFFLGRRTALPKFTTDATRALAGTHLARRLNEIPCGREAWSEYQRLCGEILEYLFCPPLNAPISERYNKTRTNRRDLVFPNYAPDGFFKFIYSRYKAEHVVADPKNYCDPIGKQEILSLANYLVGHGPGLFGMIVTRRGEDPTAYEIRREQWVQNTKMICVLTDDDLGQMIATKSHGGDPTLVLLQKIEDFRLAF